MNANTAVRVLVVVLHYGNPCLSVELARTLREADALRVADIRIFDNAAPDPVPEAWHRASENSFWAGALEQCLHLAHVEGFTHLWFLNNDVRFLRPPALRAVEARLCCLQNLLGRPVGAWSPSVAVNPYHPQMLPVSDVQAVPHSSPQARKVRLMDGVAPLLCIEAVNDAGGLDARDNPRGYGVDMWLSYRMASRGWPVLVDQTVTLRHKAHTTARTVEGFMREAALYENAFCSAHFGPGWREQLERLKAEDARPEALIITNNSLSSFSGALS